jgi:hypothetical protein
MSAMTLADRVEAFALAFPKWPAAWPRIVREQGRDVLYAIWVLGADYRNRSQFYGAYPPGFLARVMALFPDVRPMRVLHVFSGSLPEGDYVRLDSNPTLEPDIVGSVYDAGRLLAPLLELFGARFSLIVADPPYTRTDARRYGTPMVNRGRATAALADVAAPGGYLAWLDTCWPMHRKATWRTVGRILVQRSTNHRARVLSLFERTS